MKIEKFKIKKDLSSLKEYKVKYNRNFTVLSAVFLLILTAGYFKQNESFQIMHIFLYNTPIAYVFALATLTFILFALTSKIVITEERLIFILAEIFELKLFEVIDLTHIEKADYSKTWTLMGFNILNVIGKADKKLSISIDLYEKKDDLFERIIGFVNNENKIELNKDRFDDLLEKKHSLQLKNIFILTLSSLILYSGFLWVLSSKPKVKLKISENLLTFSKVFNPNNPKTNLKLGEVYLNEAKYTKAAKVLKIAVKADPENEKALYYYGVANIYLSQADMAIESFSHSYKINPQKVEYITGLAYAYSLKNDKNNSLKYANIAFNKGSKNAEDYNVLANVYFKFGQMKKGFMCLIKSRDLEKPQDKKTEPKSLEYPKSLKLYR